MNAGNRYGSDGATGRRRDQQPFGEDVARLLDHPSGPSTPDRVLALNLLRAAVPYQGVDAAKNRVAGALSSTRVRRLPGLLRPVAVMSVLLGCGAVASATIWPWPNWVVQAVQGLVPASESQPATTSREIRSSKTRRSEAAREVPAATNLEAVAHVEERDLALPGTPRREFSGRARARRASAAPVGEDTSPVLAAMRSLRRDHDPLRARSLLAAYLQRNPNGALAEEALAMSIEAAVAHQDGDAVSLAQRYLKTYPAGPFRALANRTVAGSK